MTYGDLRSCAELWRKNAKLAGKVHGIIAVDNQSANEYIGQ